HAASLQATPVPTAAPGAGDGQDAQVADTTAADVSGVDHAAVLQGDTTTTDAADTGQIASVAAPDSTNADVSDGTPVAGVLTADTTTVDGGAGPSLEPSPA